MKSVRSDAFISYCKEQLGLSEHSLRAYRQDLDAFNRYLSTKPLDIAITHELLIGFQQQIRDEGQSSPATIRRRFVTLKSYFKWFEKEDDGQPDPFFGLRMDLKVPQRLPRPIDRPTLSVLFKSARAQKYPFRVATSW